MKKIISFLTACTMLLTPFSVSAADATTDDLQLLQVAVEDSAPYTFYMVPERTSVSAEELAAGDVHISTKVYIKGDSNLPNLITSAGISYESSSSYLYFSNSADILAYASEPTQETYSGGSFISEYEMPTCFGEITAANEYAPYDCRSMSSAQFCDPINGSVIRSDGEGGLYFTRSYRKLDETTGEVTQVKNEKVEIAADDLQFNSDGTVSFTYSYYEQDSSKNYPLCTISCTIPNYDATLPAGTVLDGYHNAYSWLYNASDTTSGVSFLGYCDEFPFFSFDIVLKQNTPDGTYHVSFSTSDCRIRTTAGKYLPLQFVDTAITVGATSATISNDASGIDTICCFAENDRPLTLANFIAGTLNGRVTYADYTIQNENLQDVLTAGTSPAALYAAAGTATYIKDTPFFCGDDSTPVYLSNMTPYTKKVMIGKKGDANLDGVVNVEDAVCVLQYYARSAAGLSAKLGDDFSDEEETLAYFLADIDTCSQQQGEDGGLLSVEDAVQILTNYARNAADIPTGWENRW